MTSPRRSYRDAAIRVDEHRPEPPTGEPMTDGWLTQFGKPGDFRDEPRWETEMEVSTVCGVHNAEAATRAALGRPRRGFAVRHFPVEGLGVADYLCLHSPSHKNPQHAGIAAPVVEDDVEIHRIWWNAPERIRLPHLAQERNVS